MQHQKINHIVNIGTVQEGLINYRVRIEVEQRIEDGNVRLSMVGFVGQRFSGQISSIIREKNNGNLISYARGFDPDTVNALLDIWDTWHLNDMRAGCEHQTLLANYLYEQGRDYEHLKTIPALKKCPFCGYDYGTAWKIQDIPGEVLVRLANILNTH